MDPLRLLFFVVAWIALCNHGTYATNDVLPEFSIIGSRVPHDKEVGSFDHHGRIKLLYWTTMSHAYTLNEEGCVFSQISIQNLGTRGYNPVVYVCEGGTGTNRTVIETQGYGTREFHVDIKLYGYNKIDHSQNCTVEEKMLYTDKLPDVYVPQFLPTI